MKTFKRLAILAISVSTILGSTHAASARIWDSDFLNWHCVEWDAQNGCTKTQKCQLNTQAHTYACVYAGAGGLIVGIESGSY